ncbi:MAG TPA: FmdB family zinc ribbon protein [Gammaproteobacteria bacterium]|jgi:putative FmdB family regulatory protein|nr:FmdB family zinc ribbon protein [Gammaproteobacteria bacterium]
MPIYEYRCGACGHYLEALQKMSDSPLRKCPECGKAQLRRLVSAPQFRLKGSGWYETDFKGDGEKKRNLVEKAESAEPVKSEEKKEAAAVTGAADKPKSAEAKPKPKAAGKPKAKPKGTKSARA